MFYSETDEKIIALLIDGDNVPSAYIDAIEQEASIMGRITHKRLYYTYNDQLEDRIPNGWVDKLNPHSLRPVQVMPYKNKKKQNVKNVADAALIVDAMDIMYQGTVNTVFIVASDSDYTVLVKRLKENGIYVVGAGEGHTPHAFVNSCNEFKYLEDLHKEKPEKKQVVKGGKTKRAAAKSEKQAEQKAPLEEKATGGEEENEEKIIIPKEEINDFIIKIFKRSGKDVLDSGYIMKTVKDQYPAFDCENYSGVVHTYDFYDPTIFEVILPTDNIHTQINVRYPAQKK